jgi:hypothetical protein
MIDDDDSYELDPDGARVLIGLSAEETAEFIRLDHSIGDAPSVPGTVQDEWARVDDLRWLELYEKHEAARKPFLNSSKTRH